MDTDPWADVPSPSKTATPSRRQTPSPSPQDNPDAPDPTAPPEIPPADAADLEPEAPSQPSPPSDPVSDTFDDFEDFVDEPQAGPSQAIGDDDAFGDFDDFQEGGFEDATDLPEVEPTLTAGPSWHALHLRPMPAKSELVQQLTDLLEPPSRDTLTDEPPRQVGGLAQIMVSDSSREAYAQLTTPPMLKTLDWTRSRTRREHLISMGVPVNLDEVDSHRLSSLPPLRITTGAALASKRSSADSHRSMQDKGTLSQTRGSQSVPISAAPNGNERPREKYGLGTKPVVDMTKAEDLCGLEEDRLPLLSLDRLKALQEELVQASASASALLAWGLQYKDAQVQDSVTYNGMISELIANAAKAKSAQAAGSGGVFKRASIRRQQSGSPSLTPRVGSPAMR